MELIHPQVKLEYVTPDALRFIERIGRVCYKSEDRITEGSAEKFVAMLLKNGHESVLEHGVATIRMLTNRGVTHELVRHRIASYSQESTRYVNYNGLAMRFIVPNDFQLTTEDRKLLATIEAYYNRKVETGLTPQQARYFLPNGLATEIVVTMNFREWRHFLNLRDSKKAHPDMQEVAGMVREVLSREVPLIFENLTGVGV